MTARRIAVLGAGAWGLTLADLLGHNGHHVTVWDRSADVIDLLRHRRTRGKPADLVVHKSIQFDADLMNATGQAQTVVCAVPSFAVRDICGTIATLPGGFGDRMFISCSKGIEEETLLLPSQIFAEKMGEAAVRANYAALAGPSHAEEVCRKVPTVIVMSAAETKTAEAARDLFMTKWFRVYTQSDLLGVELGGALKNVIAIAVGACDGLGYGDNTKAALVTRGVAEIARAGAALGAQPQTLAGLAGLGDLIVTAMSRHSRNRMFGELIARGRTVEQALEEVGAVVEGYRTSRSAHALAKKSGVEMPLVAAVHALLHGKASMEEAISMLLDRMPKPEVY